MAEMEPWEELDLVNGIGEVKFSSWHDVVTYLHKPMLSYDKYVWRGQRRADWKLDSTLGRHMRERGISPWHGYAESHLETFKFASRGRRGGNPQPITDDRENDWWALAQHHGMMTPLLDWSVSPFVAAYFAYIEEGDGDQTDHRVIYGLCRPRIEALASELADAENERRREAAKNDTNPLAKALRTQVARPEIEFIRPMSDQNPRLLGQNGLFTRAPLGKVLEDWISNHFNGSSEYVLMKLLTPNADREDCLRTLNRMNINHLTLFPDLDGASKYCNLALQIDNY